MSEDPIQGQDKPDRPLPSTPLVTEAQRNAYNYQKLNIGTDCLFIELDWKQKILIGFKKMLNYK